MSFVTEEDVARLTYAERKMALLTQIWSAITSVREPRIVDQVIKLLDIAFPAPPSAPAPAPANDATNVLPFSPAA